MKYQYITESPAKLNVSINSDTTGLTLSVVDSNYIGDTWIRLSATDFHGHTSWSDTVVVHIINSQPPVWEQIPQIQFANNIIYSNLYLNQYSSDPENQQITYTAISNKPNLVVTLIEATTQVLFSAKNGFFGEARVVFRATDTDGNSSSTVVDLLLSDAVPPQGNLFYHFNPVASHNISFFVIADSSTQNFSSAFSRDGSTIPLDFAIFDQDSTKYIWKANYNFTQSGNYLLKTWYSDQNSISAQDSIRWSVTFAKRNGGNLRTAFAPITAQYNENQFGDGDFLAISQNESNIGETNFEIISPDRNNAAIEVMLKNSGQISGNNYAFFTVSDSIESEIETFIDSDGNFRANIPVNQKFRFKNSMNSAAAYPISDYQLNCYPNPFNAEITFQYSLRERSATYIRIYNILGQQIYQKYLGEPEAGNYRLLWNSKNNAGINMPSGMYFVRLSNENGIVLTQKIMLVK